MKRVLWLVMLCLLGGCSGSNQQAAIRDRQLDYQAAYIEPKLKVPKGLANTRVNEKLIIPGVDEPTAGLYGGSFEAPRAEVAARGLTIPAIRKYELDGQHWLSVPEDMASIWPEIERFISENKLTVFYSSKDGDKRVFETNTFRGINAHSGSRIIRHFPPEFGSIVLRFSLQPGLRMNTSEVRLTVAAGKAKEDQIGRVLDEFKYHLEIRRGAGMAVSRALSLIEIGNRMRLRRAEGLDELVIQADTPRVFGVAVDTLRGLGASIDGGDLEKGILNIRYVRKATERRLGTMTPVNRAIATSIEDPVGSYQIQMLKAEEGLILKAIPTGAAATIGGANELIGKLKERLY